MTLNAALIGVGMVADMHAAAIAATKGAVRLAGVLGRDPERALSFAETHSVPRTYPDLAGLIADRPDFAILITPPNARADICAGLATAGIPVLAEKPLERDLPRARALVEVFEAAGLPFGVTLQHRMRPAAQALKSRLNDGVLGEIATVECRVPWWRDQSYYEKPGRGTYAQDGGGVLITQAIHTIDLMLQLAGPVAEVQAIAARSALHDLEAEDFAAAALRFESGAAGSLMASVTHFPGGSEEITLNGTRGSATLSANALTIRPHEGGEEVIGAAGGSGGGADPMAFSHDWHRAVIADFANALIQGRPPAIPARSALPAQALIDAIQTSARSGIRQIVET